MVTGDLPVQDNPSPYTVLPPRDKYRAIVDDLVRRLKGPNMPYDDTGFAHSINDYVRVDMTPDGTYFCEGTIYSVGTLGLTIEAPTRGLVFIPWPSVADVEPSRPRDRR